jgi:hypothetical protein
MRKVFMLAAIVAAVVLPTASQAQFTLGLRLGYAPAMGDVYEVDGEASALSDGVKSQIPIQIDAGYKLTPALTLGAYFSYGFGQLGSDLSDVCDEFDLDCSARSVRLGVQALYAFKSVSPQWVPWAGAGFGYEWASVTLEGGGAKMEQGFSGFEFLNLQAGVDYAISPKFAIGPYAMFSIAQYSSGTLSMTGEEDVEVFDTADTAMHQWLHFGVRGQFDL